MSEHLAFVPRTTQYCSTVRTRVRAVPCCRKLHRASGHSLFGAVSGPIYRRRNKGHMKRIRTVQLGQRVMLRGKRGLAAGKSGSRPNCVYVEWDEHMPEWVHEPELQLEPRVE